MNKLKTAIVGCGGISASHVEALLYVNKSTITAVCDKIPEKAKALGEELCCNYYTDFDQMLLSEEIDVLHICTPHFLHMPMTVKALEKGIHVFCEKPLGLDTDECEKTVAAWKKSGKNAGVCFQNRLNPTSVAMKDIVDSRKYGRILGVRGIVTWSRGGDYYAKSDWRGKWATEGGGLLMNQMIHTLDLMQWLCGGVKSLKGNFDTRTLSSLIEEEDTADATMSFNNGAVGLFYASNSFTTNSSVLIEIHMEKAQLRFYNDKVYVIIDGKEELIATNEIKEGEKSYWGSGHKLIIEEFYNGILNTTPYITVEDGMAAVAVAKAIYASSKEKKEILL